MPDRPEGAAVLANHLQLVRTRSIIKEVRSLLHVHVHTYIYMSCHVHVHVCTSMHICMYVHVCIHQLPGFNLRPPQAVKNCQKKSSKHSPGIQVKKRANLDLSTAPTRSSYAWRHVCAMSS